MARVLLFFLITSVLTLGACQNSPTGQDRSSTSALSGASSSSVQVMHAPPKAAPGAGVLLSAWAGQDIAAFMSQDDRLKNQQAEARAYTAPIGQQVTWHNLTDNNAGTVTPVADSYNALGAYCRQFQETVTLGGQQKQGGSKACQEPDGSWKIAS